MPISLTETQAKTKWCPFSRTGAYTDNGPTAISQGLTLMTVTTNRDPRPDVQSSCNCIASDCMAWNWNYEYLTKDGKEEAGYCGLMK